MWASVTDSGVSNVIPVRLFRIKVGNERGLTNTSQTSSWNEVFMFGRGGVLTGFETIVVKMKEEDTDSTGGTSSGLATPVKLRSRTRWDTRGEVHLKLTDVLKWVERKARSATADKTSKCLVQWFPLKLSMEASAFVSDDVVEGDAEDAKEGGQEEGASAAASEEQDVGIVCLSFQFAVEPKLPHTNLKNTKSFLGAPPSKANRHRRVSSHTPMYRGKRELSMAAERSMDDAASFMFGSTHETRRSMAGGNLATPGSAFSDAEATSSGSKWVRSGAASSDMVNKSMELIEKRVYVLNFQLLGVKNLFSEDVSVDKSVRHFIAAAIKGYRTHCRRQERCHSRHEQSEMGRDV